MKRDFSEKKINWANTIAIVGLIAAVLFNAWQIRLQNQTLLQNQRITSAQFILDLRNQVYNSLDTAIENAIESGGENIPIMSKQAEHPFTSIQISNYIGNFETIGDLVDDGVIDTVMAYEEFSYDIIKAWCNKDIQQYISKMRQSDSVLTGPQAYYYGFEVLAKYTMRREHKNCSCYDSL